jgi:hypothetical protein
MQRSKHGNCHAIVIPYTIYDIIQNKATLRLPTKSGLVTYRDSR